MLLLGSIMSASNQAASQLKWMIIMTQTLQNRRSSIALTGNVTQREDFPKQDSIGPHVTLKGVDAVENTLGRHPLNWQTSLQERAVITRAVPHPCFYLEKYALSCLYRIKIFPVVSKTFSPADAVSISC